MSLFCFSGQVNRLGTTTFECEQKQGMEMYDSAGYDANLISN